ncbi:biotin synthase [Lachnospiraceae bacterium A10]|nr:biotin synthase [Lachnospiraceae bacterium A10]
MDQRGKAYIDQLEREHHLAFDEYVYLLKNRSDELAEYAAKKAVAVRQHFYGNAVYTRGLIEFTNICKNNCLYCGIRRGNATVERYRLSEEEILQSTEEGYQLGFRTFVLQGGEDPYYTDDRICSLVRKIKEQHRDVAITLSIGEKERESYQAFFDAGANRYLLRHETANEDLYRKLHPEEMSWKHRMDCLRALKEIGYQVGAGFMVEPPYQKVEDLAMELQFIEDFKPDMCGIGPYIVHHETPFRGEKSGTVEMTCFLLSLIRLIYPEILLPATTALGTMHPRGRELGIESGANVVMPNLTPVGVRKQYELYENKICTGEESAQCRGCLDQRMKSIGYELVIDRGDRFGWNRR